MPVLSAVAAALGISSLRLVVYAIAGVAVIAGGLTIRQHHIDKGYASAITAVKKQDGKAKSAAEAVERKTAVCTETTGYWDVISQSCKLEDEE